MNTYFGLNALWNIVLFKMQSYVDAVLTTESCLSGSFRKKGHSFVKFVHKYIGLNQETFFSFSKKILEFFFL